MYLDTDFVSHEPSLRRMRATVKCLAIANQIIRIEVPYPAKFAQAVNLVSESHDSDYITGWDVLRLKRPECIASHQPSATSDL